MTSLIDARDTKQLGVARAVVTAAILSLLVVACATSPPEELASAEEQAQFSAAVQRVAVDRKGGIAALEAFLTSWPDSPLADDAAYRLGELALEEGDLEGAQRHFYYVIQQHGDRGLADGARLEAAKLEYLRGDANASRRLLADMDIDRLPADKRLDAYSLRVRIAEDPVERLRFLDRIKEIANDDELEQLAIDAEIDATLAQMSGEDLLRAADRAGRRDIGGRILFELAERALLARDLEALEETLDELEDFPLDDAGEERLASLHARFAALEAMADHSLLPTFAEVIKGGWREVHATPGTIGVVLPLSGPFASYGEQSLRGILLAAGVFGPEASRSALASVDDDSLSYAELLGSDASGLPRIVVRDSAGDPNRAAAAVRELAARDDLVAIVGPLLKQECEAAAQVAEADEVPILTLTSRQEIPHVGENVFRLRTTPDDEVRYLVEHAMNALGAKRFAILYPQDAFGRGMRERFWEVVEGRGGFVTAASSYEPEAVDFEDPIREMIGYVLLTKEEKAALKLRKELLRRGRRLEPEAAAVVREVAYGLAGPSGDPLPPIVDFDALFIPDSHEKIVLIAPQLAFHELDQVQLLGSAGWNHPDLTRIARNHVRGAVISTPFYLESPLPFVQRFVQDYEATFDVPPDSYSAHAYDAMQLLFAQLGSGRDSRDELREGTLEVSAYPGASGLFTLMPDGNARKRPFLLQVRGGQIVPLDTVN